MADLKTYTSMTYESNSGDAKSRWITVIQDPITGVTHSVNYTSSEQEGRDWGHNVLNTKNGSPSESLYTIVHSIQELDQVLMAYDDDYSSNYKAPGFSENLKCKCWRCDKDINVSQSYDYMTSKYKVTMNCHGQEETKSFTAEEINSINSTGGKWVAFLY